MQRVLNIYQIVRRLQNVRFGKPINGSADRPKDSSISR